MLKKYVLGVVGVYVVVLALLLSGTLLFSGCKHSSPEKRITQVINYLIDELDLNAEQQEMLADMQHEFIEKHAEMHASRKQTMDIFIAEIKSDTFDQGRVKNAIQQKKAQMDEMITFLVARLAEFHSTLSATQKEKLVAKLEGLRKWHSYAAE